MSLVEDLIAAVGSAGVVSGPDVPPDYGVDETLKAQPVVPAAVVKPGSAADVRAIVEVARRNGTPVTARGAGTGLSGACIPLADGIVDERLLAIGPLRRGVLWESTAIPELREQAAVVAQRLLGRQTHVVSRVAG